jgi:hypothetical protein
MFREFGSPNLAGAMVVFSEFLASQIVVQLVRRIGRNRLRGIHVVQSPSLLNDRCEPPFLHQSAVEVLRRKIGFEPCYAIDLQ